MSGANLRKFILFDQNGRELDLTSNSNVPIEIKTKNGVSVDAQYPLHTDNSTIHANDLWVAESDMGNFSGSVTDLFDNLHTVIVDSTANNPKELLIHFERSTVIYAIGLGSFTGSFSNVEIQLLTSGGGVNTIADFSTDNTDRGSQTFLTPAGVGANAIKFIFHTADTITLSNVFLVLYNATIARLQGTDPNNNVIDIAATSDGNLKVAVEDQVFRPFSLRMNQVVQTGLTLAVDAVVDSRTITVSPGHGLIANDFIVLLEENGAPQFFFAKITSVAVDVLTLDTLVSYPFTSAGTVITQYDPTLNKNGSVTTYKAELRNPFSVSIDVTRIIFHITDDTAMDDGKFGGLPALTNGVSFRKNISATNNIHYWNVKTNGAIGELTFDKAYDDKAPAGVYGFSARLTYAGQSKHGVAIRLNQGEAIELLIQDDLTGLASFSITAEGHFNE